MHARAGGKAGLLCLTDGQAGRTGGISDRATLGACRREELRRATLHLGIRHLFTAGLEDGGLDGVGDEAGARLIEEIASYFAADLLLTFGPEGASGHADHKACWRWTLRAAHHRTVYAATFPPGFADLPRGGTPLPVTTVVDVGPLEAAKRRAFLEHRTQQDHLALFDRILAALGGGEYYHRVRPPWPAGPIEKTLRPAVGDAGRGPR